MINLLKLKILSSKMRKFLEKHQFIKCGIISITKDFNDTQSLRLAYQKILNTKKVDNV